jgi:hypothetical protein
MDMSIPAAGLQSASAALEAAANGLNQVFQNGFNPLTAGSTMGDSVDLSTQVVSLMKSNLDFEANVKLELIDNQINQSTFSLIA